MTERRSTEYHQQKFFRLAAEDAVVVRAVKAASTVEVLEFQLVATQTLCEMVTVKG
jgi:hypothetical protein